MPELALRSQTAIRRTALLGLLWSALFCSGEGAAAAAAPEFTHARAADWINSAPLTLAQLRGKVVLLEFWTYECINCLRSAAWIQSIARLHADAGLVVIGVHTPELQQERSVANVRQAVERLGIHYPVMIDGDYSYWNALENRYWPAFYLIDRDGRMREQAAGEMHSGDAQAKRLEASIAQLLSGS